MRDFNTYMDSRPRVLEPDTQLVPNIDQDTLPGAPVGSYAVRVFNNDITPFRDVVGVFVISCGYSETLGTRYAKEVHLKGSCVAYWASQDRCLMVIADFKKIGVKAELVEEK